jgi:hypothetical protein
MAVLRVLLNYGLDQEAQRDFSEFGTTPGDAVQQMFSDPELAALLRTSRVQAALSDIRADPERALLKYEGDKQVGWAAWVGRRARQRGACLVLRGGRWRRRRRRAVCCGCMVSQRRLHAGLQGCPGRQ